MTTARRVFLLDASDPWPIDEIEAAAQALVARGLDPWRGCGGPLGRKSEDQARQEARERYDSSLEASRDRARSG